MKIDKNICAELAEFAVFLLPFKMDWQRPLNPKPVFSRFTDNCLGFVTSPSGAGAQPRTSDSFLHEICNSGFFGSWASSQVLGRSLDPVRSFVVLESVEILYVEINVGSYQKH